MRTRPSPTDTLTVSGILQRKCACGQHTIAGGECDGCSKKDPLLQRATRNSETETRNSGGVPQIVHEVLRSSGQPLETATRAFFEPRFGHDFSHVRVHTDSKASESARAVNALAYTVGRDVVFEAGQFAPHTNAGRRLMAHELTHVVQTRANCATSNDIHRGSVSDRFEQEAEQTSMEMSTAGPSRQISVSRFSSGPPILSRQRASAHDEPLPELERPVTSTESAGSPLDAGPGSSAPASCVTPKSVTMVSAQALEFPDYLTGGGICAVMQVNPAVNNLCAGITEETTSAPKATCPDSLIKGGLCQGSSTFPLGKAQGGACSSIKPKSNEFVDRHSIQLSSTSLLHDSERNPKGLKACQFTCNQRYYVQTGAAQVTLGEFQIQNDLTEGTRDGKKITKVTTTKTAKK